MSLFLPDTGLLFWMALSFGIVFFVVAKWGFPVIIRMVEERKAYIDKSLQTADEVNRQFAEIKVRCEALLEEARGKQLAMLRETALSKDQILTDAKETARREAQKIVEASQKQVRLEREAVLTDLQSQVALIAIDIAGKVLRDHLKEGGHQMEFVERLLKESWKEKLGNQLQ